MSGKATPGGRGDVKIDVKKQKGEINTSDSPISSDAEPSPRDRVYKYIIPFGALRMEDVPVVGGKNASLGEMYSQLSTMGVRVPNGFATTANAYRHYLKFNGLTDRITTTLDQLDTKDTQALAKAGASIRAWIVDAEMPPDLRDEIIYAYKEMEAQYGPSPDVAVRSSATAEDLPDASFAGQQETYLNVHGADNLIRMCKRVLASLFTNRAISYRVDKGFQHMQVALSIGVQKMVRSDIGTSGVMFTLDTESGFRDVIMIAAAYGLGENIVQGSVNPDEYLVYKPLLGSERPHGQSGIYEPIIRHHLGQKAIKMIYSKDAITANATTNVNVKKGDQEKFCLSDHEILRLAEYGLAIEKHYSEKAGCDRPMDIEWAKDGIDGELYVVQARPETVHSTKNAAIHEVYHLIGSSEERKKSLLCTGRSIGSKVGVGAPRVVLEAAHMHELKPGEILVTDITDPDWEPIMKIAGGIVTNRGGRVCHAAIIARELGIPAVVGTGNATEVLAAHVNNADASGMTGTSEPRKVTVSCCEGDVGAIYDGEVPCEKEVIDLTTIGRPHTKMMLIVGNPEQAFTFAALPNDGVGLARVEFIISNHIGVHPQVGNN
ncbi:hypothetical protein CYMTET_32516 [Cymbomonas tetramitiformis]|uniref:pyruvate, water dikinase n=1 Tax=Cymbomonas tetramitiformis TaxID=36881 RepID=A0AAE0FEX0_9CHLO|nr:hypothetical protein CYMTET_32516 [Cymbomonas tetramitiformis]